MAGILGTTWRAGEERSVGVAVGREARATLSHRGPRLATDWYDDRLFLGHTQGNETQVRGPQPLVASDGSVGIVLDGTLANARALRQELAGFSTFRTNDSAVVLLQGYRAWGLDALLPKLRGGFAFAIYDRAQAELALVRDPLGVKPLYYHARTATAEAPAAVQFASELTALTELLQDDQDGRSLTLDHTAAFDFLTYGYVPAPKTLYLETRKLAAGESWPAGRAGLECSSW